MMEECWKALGQAAVGKCRSQPLVTARLKAGTGTRPEAARRENHAGSCRGFQG
jgi:hypothetical protein